MDISSYMWLLTINLASFSPPHFDDTMPALKDGMINCEHEKVVRAKDCSIICTPVRKRKQFNYNGNACVHHSQLKTLFFQLNATNELGICDLLLLCRWKTTEWMMTKLWLFAENEIFTFIWSDSDIVIFYLESFNTEKEVKQIKGTLSMKGFHQRARTWLLIHYFVPFILFSVFLSLSNHFDRMKNRGKLFRFYRSLVEFPAKLKMYGQFTNMNMPFGSVHMFRWLKHFFCGWKMFRQIFVTLKRLLIVLKLEPTKALEVFLSLSCLDLDECGVCEAMHSINDLLC